MAGAKNGGEVVRLTPPRRAPPDPELVAALGEARLLPAEEAALLARIRRDPVARAELRALYRGRWRAMVGESVVVGFTCP